jgi:hypothetical protein
MALMLISKTDFLKEKPELIVPVEQYFHHCDILKYDVAPINIGLYKEMIYDYYIEDEKQNIKLIFSSNYTGLFYKILYNKKKKEYFKI